MSDQPVRKPSPVIGVLLAAGVLAFGIFMIVSPDSFATAAEPSGRRAFLKSIFVWLLSTLTPRGLGAIVSIVGALWLGSIVYPLFKKRAA
ncbi:MAG: hypothetical protein IBJ11_07670 [Phycisphaerales bacterium]|nr:hypothetical protein [Phycisphaerales bacterium]